MAERQQLIKKNCSTGEYENIYPITDLSSIIDSDTGEFLYDTIEKFNHIYLPFQSSKPSTRLQIPEKLRRTGLWITYVVSENNTITEWFKGSNFDEKSWGDSKNWVQYVDDKLLEDMVNNILSWYILR